MKEVFFKGKFIPFADAKIGVMTHAFNYGTGVFEGIRGYWNPEHKQKYILRLKEHYERLYNSCKIIKVIPKYSIAEMCALTVELAKRNGYKQDTYIRPIAYKSSEIIGLGLTGLEDDILIYTAPFGEYLDITKGIKVCVSSWSRVDDNAIPARAKTTGAYINSSLAKADAKENGYDEAILMSNGKISEGSGENLFIVRGGKVITPQVSDNILEGITRADVIDMLKNELKLEVIERSVNRTELYVADELFFTGTGAQITPITSVDRRTVGTGKIGPITANISKLYFDAVRGNNPKYKHWLTPVY